jgi:membrane-associated phospholipid phosphatase
MRILFVFYLAFYFSASQAQNLDIDLLRKLNVERNTSLDKPMEYISTSEYAIGIAMPISVCAAAWVKRDRKLLEKGVNMSLAMVLNTGGTYVLKRLVNRSRPATVYPDIQAFENERFHSFPSGHTSNAFVAATSLSLNFKKWYIIVPSFAWASAVGYSRMHMGVHYPTDVLAGALLGSASAIATYKANQWIKRYYIKKYVNKSI